MATHEALVHAVARQILRGLRESLTIAGQIGRAVEAVNMVLHHLRTACDDCIVLTRLYASESRIVFTVAQRANPLDRQCSGTGLVRLKRILAMSHAPLVNHPSPRSVRLRTGEASADRCVRPTVVLLLSRSARRSLTAAEILLAAGFRDVHSLAGGMGAWHDAGLPVER